MLLGITNVNFFVVYKCGGVVAKVNHATLLKLLNESSLRLLYADGLRLSVKLSSSWENSSASAKIILGGPNVMHKYGKMSDFRSFENRSCVTVFR